MPFFSQWIISSTSSDRFFSSLSPKSNPKPKQQFPQLELKFNSKYSSKQSSCNRNILSISIHGYQLLFKHRLFQRTRKNFVTYNTPIPKELEGIPDIFMIFREILCVTILCTIMCLSPVARKQPSIRSWLLNLSHLIFLCQRISAAQIKRSLIDLKIQWWSKTIIRRIREHMWRKAYPLKNLTSSNGNGLEPKIGKFSCFYHKNKIQFILKIFTYCYDIVWLLFLGIW